MAKPIEKMNKKELLVYLKKLIIAEALEGFNICDLTADELREVIEDF